MSEVERLRIAIKAYRDIREAITCVNLNRGEPEQVTVDGQTFMWSFLANASEKSNHWA
jgi:hypothetical protein